MTELSLTVSRVINAPIEAVFDAWLNPDMLNKFMVPGEGMSAKNASSSPSEGGRFDLLMCAGEDEMPHGGVYKTIDRHSQIVFTWESPFSIDGSEVTLNLSKVEGGTNIELTHVKFPNEESRDNHQGGWVGILGALEGALA